LLEDLVRSGGARTKPGATRVEVGGWSGTPDGFTPNGGSASDPEGQLHSWALAEPSVGGFAFCARSGTILRPPWITRRHRAAISLIAATNQTPGSLLKNKLPTKAAYPSDTGAISSAKQPPHFHGGCEAAERVLAGDGSSCRGRDDPSRLTSLRHVPEAGPSSLAGTTPGMRCCGWVRSCNGRRSAGVL
jgi:hypothetical protein